jgi:hypothetical protein
MGKVRQKESQKQLDNSEPTGERTRTFLTGVPLGEQIVDQLFRLMTKANRDPRLRAMRNTLNGAIAACEVHLDDVREKDKATAATGDASE